MNYIQQNYAEASVINTNFHMTFVHRERSVFELKSNSVG